MNLDKEFYVSLDDISHRQEKKRKRVIVLMTLSVIAVTVLVVTMFGNYLHSTEPVIIVEQASCTPVPVLVNLPLPPTPEPVVCPDVQEFAPETQLRLSCRGQYTAIKEAYYEFCFPLPLTQNGTAACYTLLDAMLLYECELDRNLFPAE